MHDVLPSHAEQDVGEPLQDLSENLERTIAFAEECRWRFPELHEEADELVAKAMALFGKSVKVLRGGTAARG